MHLVHQRCQKMNTAPYDLRLKTGFPIQRDDLLIQGSPGRPPLLYNGDLVIGNDPETDKPQDNEKTSQCG